MLNSLSELLNRTAFGMSHCMSERTEAAVQVLRKQSFKNACN